MCLDSSVCTSAKTPPQQQAPTAKQYKMQTGSLQEFNTRCSRGGEDSISERQPDTAMMVEKREKIGPRRSLLSRQWSNCSLCSIDSLDLEETLPIPGRESHTSDMDAFCWHVHRLQALGRLEGDPSINVKFWRFIRIVLEGAHEVGYSGFTDTEEVATKGPKDNSAFANKIRNTSIINPIHPAVIAKEADVPLDDVLTELVYATRSGMVTMRWAPGCERYGRFVCYNRKQSRIQPKKYYCNGCKYTNAIDCLRKIKVAFVLNLEVFYVLAENFEFKAMKKAMKEDEMFAIVPATFTGSGFRYSLGCGGDQMLRPALAAGKYRMHCPIAMADSCLVVERDATEDDEPHVLAVHVSDIVYRGGADQVKMLTVPHGKIHMDIYTDTQSFFVCWMKKDNNDQDVFPVPSEEDRPRLLSAQELMANVTYQQVFENSEFESEHFNSAVKRMVLEPDSEPAGLIPVSGKVLSSV